jgi:uncharacterized protein (DUF1800 family)
MGSGLARGADASGIGNPRDWLRSQLAGGPPRLEGAPAAAEIGEAIRAFRAAGQGDEGARRDARRKIVALSLAEQRTALTARVVSERPFVERLVAFWSNHLCVSAAAKIPVAAMAGSYEREVIRPHVFGKFEDMVLASARHPAMLVYLDNAQSMGPASRTARIARGRQQRGLNENYARELLELHTLGVAGGYAQGDVTELARLLTGWTVEGIGPRRSTALAPQFQFLPALHEPGNKQVLGARYGEGPGEGERAIRALCRHASTATHVATKLVTHFVADEPPPVAVARIAKVFRETEGDLARVTQALVELPEAWGENARKFRTPQDWMVATLRALGSAQVPDTVIASLRQLRHPLWAPASPKGFGDTRTEWADPDSLMNRAELARSIGRRATRDGFDPARLLDVAMLPASDPARGMIADRSIPADQRVALALAGPAFQWR